MRQQFRSTVGAAVLALVVASAVLCPCPLMTAPEEGSHHSCGAEASLRALDSDCCSEIPAGIDAVVGKQRPATPVPSRAFVLPVASSSGEIFTVLPESPPLFASPPLVLRI